MTTKFETQPERDSDQITPAILEKTPREAELERTVNELRLKQKTLFTRRELLSTAAGSALSAILLTAGGIQLNNHLQELHNSRLTLENVQKLEYKGTKPSYTGWGVRYPQELQSKYDFQQIIGNNAVMELHSGDTIHLPVRVDNNEVTDSENSYIQIFESPESTDQPVPMLSIRQNKPNDEEGGLYVDVLLRSNRNNVNLNVVEFFNVDTDETHYVSIGQNSLAEDQFVLTFMKPLTIPDYYADTPATPPASSESSS